jgi:hypothetical protein
MTFTLALTLPNINLVAADTRVNLTLGSDSSPLHQDGPSDLIISVESPKYDDIAPFRFRKIRQVSNGWVTSAGDYMLGRSILSLIAQHGTDSFTSISQLLHIECPRLKDEIQKQTGFSDKQLDNTVIFGAPFAQTSVWVISFNESRMKTNPECGNYIINWPQAVPAEVIDNAQNQFKQELGAALSRGSLPCVVRAAVRMVSMSAKYATDVGIYSQLGVTLRSSTAAKTSFYVQGLSDDLLSMSDSSLTKNLERLV